MMVVEAFRTFKLFQGVRRFLKIKIFSVGQNNIFRGLKDFSMCLRLFSVWIVFLVMVIELLQRGGGGIFSGGDSNYFERKS